MQQHIYTWGAKASGVSAALRGRAQCLAVARHAQLTAICREDGGCSLQRARTVGGREQRRAAVKRPQAPPGVPVQRHQLAVGQADQQGMAARIAAARRDGGGACEPSGGAQAASAAAGAGGLVAACAPAGYHRQLTILLRCACCCREEHQERQGQAARPRWAHFRAGLPAFVLQGRAGCPGTYDPSQAWGGEWRHTGSAWH